MVELALGLALIAGAVAARAGRIRLHKYLQSTVVLVNLPIALASMVPHYLADVLPALPGQWSRPVNLLPTAMLLFGGTAEALGIFILLVAGTDLVPERWRFRRYRRWMRGELLLWWVVLGLGISVYVVWYS